MKELPDWDIISKKMDTREALTELESFIYSEEPAGEKASEEFRAKLSNVIKEISENET